MIADDIIQRVCMAEADNERVELHRVLDGRDHPWLVLELVKRPLAGQASGGLMWCEKRHQSFVTEQIARAAYEVSVRRITGTPSGSRCSCDDFCDDPCPVHARENQLQNELIQAHARIAELEADLYRVLHEPPVLKLDPDSVARMRRPDQEPKP